MYRASSIQLFSAQLGKRNEDSFPVRTTALNEGSFLHSCQLMREAAFIPCHHTCQRLLPHLTFANGSEARQYTKLRTSKPGRLRDIAANAIQHIFVHESEGVPDPKLLWG